MKILRIKAQSELISTILIILIVVVSVTILSAFVIEFVKNQIESSKCIELLNPPIMEIRNNPSYTCYEPAPSNSIKIQIHFSKTKASLDGFSLEIGGADTKSYRIINNSQDADIMMNSGESTLVLPLDNSERTYKISGINSKPDTIRLYPITKDDKTCQSISILNDIEEC